MAVTEGRVQRIVWASPIVCVTVGPTPTNVELLFVQFRATDSEAQLGFKRNLVNLLARAKAARWPVRIGHPDSGAEIDGASLPGFDISPVGHAVRDDAFSITGSGIPAGARVVFDTPIVNIEITPDLVRSHWVFIARLPAIVPLGRTTVRLAAPGWTSDEVPVEVTTGPPVPVRVLYTGQPKTRPYTIAFVANPSIQTEAGAFIADPVLTSRQTYLDVIGYCLRNILTETESLLRRGNWDREIRVVSIFDPTSGVSDVNSLAHELSPNLMETRRDRLNGYVSRYSEMADIVFVMHGSTSHNRATAWYTTDDAAKATTVFTYDGTARTHGHFPATPGSAALPLDMDQTGLTPLHEFGHAASDFNNGKVNDLYVDSIGSGFVVNKKARSAAGGTIPTNFGTYDGTTFTSDQNRDGLGYPAAWSSYHPTLNDAANPNLMDNYWLAAGGDPQVCRLDQLTSEWFIDRLRAKLNR